MPTTTTQTVSCSCCGRACGCPGGCSPIKCSLNVLVSATGNLAAWDGLAGTATVLGSTATNPWTFNPSLGTNPCAPGIGPQWTSYLMCDTLGGTPCLSLGGNSVDAPGFGKITTGSAPCAGITYYVNGSDTSVSIQTLTSFSCSPFHEVLHVVFGDGSTLTLDITE